MKPYKTYYTDEQRDNQDVVASDPISDKALACMDEAIANFKVGVASDISLRRHK